ncbi:MAG: HAD family hydrolase [Candidatus Andersenbacteria bacterium]|nr:HAD family hydrolase [Candidatus Andersenbacteria bacterium]
MTNKVIFWDFDGVIADTFTMCFAIASQIYPGISSPEYQALFEGNINKTNPRQKPVGNIDFFAEFSKTLPGAALTSGIADVIATLSKTHTNVVVSSTISPLIDTYLTRQKIRHHFAEILGNDVAHSKVEKFKLAFKKHQTSANYSVMITDTAGDIKEAKEVSIPVIGVTWGYHPHNSLLQAQPTAMVHTTQELLQAILKTLP